MIPVKLEKEPRKEVYKLSTLEDDIVINPAIIEKLKQAFGIELPKQESIQELTYDETIVLIRESLANQKTWIIKDNVFLSLFSYAKASLVQDIIENSKRILSHPILQAISGDLINYRSSYKEPLPASRLDRVKPELVFQILDADSSQQVVIEAAKTGSSFVVQGPPGTGKSQTIVNMISELIGDGKSVLLVAEKETALSVVYQRLAECGLAHFCLNLHHKGTTDKRKFVENLSQTLKYLEPKFDTDDNNLFFERLISTRSSLNSYLETLHTKEQPLDKSPFELFGELLKKEHQEVPNINVTFSNFNQWNQNRLQEAKDLLNQLAQFLPIFQEEKTTIWAKSSLDCYSYEMELQITETIEEFQHAIFSSKKIDRQLQAILQVQSLSNLESLNNCCSELSHILKAPRNLPENWIGVELSTAQSAYSILKTDVQEIEKNKLSPEVENLLSQLSFFIPFLRGDKTTIWEQSTVNSYSEMLELEIKEKIHNFQQSISLMQTASQQLQLILQIPPLLNLKDIPACSLALQHILKASPNLPENWIGVELFNAQDTFSNLKNDVKFLEENEPFFKQKYHPELFSLELAALANRYQKYSRFWLIRVFNPKYRRDSKLLKKLSTKKEKFSYNELKRDLAQAARIQAVRQELYRSNYPACQIFGNLFNPEVSNQAQLKEIEQALNWLIELQNYSFPADSVQRAINSSSKRSELSELLKQLESLSEDIRQGIDFLSLYFNDVIEKD